MEEKSRRERGQKKLPILLIFGLVLLFVFLNIFSKKATAATAPLVITYQGKLLISSKLATTTQNMYFILYDASSGGNILYSASGTIATPQAVSTTPTQGLFSVNLGDTGTNALSSAIFQNNASVYLEVRINSDTLSPRKRITAVPYAFNARYLDGVGVNTLSSTTYIPQSDSSGNFTFNSTTVSSTLTVQTAPSAATTFNIISSTTGTSILTVRVNGNVGINTSTPSEKLQVVGNISNIIGPNTTIAQIATTSVGAAPRGVFVSGRYAYTANYNSNTISVVDISNPSVPVQISTTSVERGPVGIYVSGRYAYVTNYDSNTISVVDISNPFAPRQTATGSVGVNPQSIFVSGHYAYVANYTDNDISVVDISNPAVPIQIATTSVGELPASIYVSGRYAYTANNGSNSISVIDISNPSTPVQIATTSVGGNPNAIFVSGRYAYVANGGPGSISVVDISNPSAPIQKTTTPVGSNPISIYVSGRYAYVVNEVGNNISVVDISNPLSPFQIITASVGTYPESVYVSGRYAYVANYGPATISVVDISGTEVSSLIAHSAEVGNLQSRNDILAQGNIMAGTSLLVGAGGIMSNGALSVFASSTGATSSIFDISSAQTGNIFKVFANGLVAIGTSTPLAQLDINVGAGKLPFAVRTSTAARTQMFTIDRNGNVGINSSSPIASLSVQGTGGTNPLEIASSTGASMLRVLTNGNIGINSSTPNYALSVAGTSSVNAIYTSNDGTVSLPAYSFSSSPNTGLYSLSAGSVSMAAAGSESMRWASGSVALTAAITASVFGGGVAGRNNGSALGIYGGSLTTARGLTIAGGGSTYSATANDQSGVYFNYRGNNGFAPTSGNANFIALDLDADIQQTGTAIGDYTVIRTNVIETNASGTNKLLMNLRVNTSSKFIVDNLGRVGLNTTTLSAMLSITGTTTQNFVDIVSSTGGSILKVLSNGNVGINSSSPQALLSVEGAVLINGSVTSTNARFTNLNVDSCVGCAGSATTTWIFSGANVFLVTSTSLVGIGTSTPISKLTVQGAGTENPFSVVSSTAAASSMFTILTNGNVGINSSTPNSSLSIVQSAVTGTTPSILTLRGGTNKEITASTEDVDVNFDLNRTVSWAGSSNLTVTNQRAVLFQAPTYTASSSVNDLTFTNAATVAISGAPTLSTAGGMTGSIAATRSAALWIQAGQLYLPLGTAAAPALTWIGGAGSLNTGLYMGTQSPDKIAFTIQGTASGFVDASGWNSGVPGQATITTYGLSAITQGAALPLSIIGGLAAGTNNTDVVIRSAVTRTAGNLLSIRNNTATTTVIDYRGYLGLNTTTPIAQFSIQGTSTNPFAIVSSTGSSMLTILTNGNVGIGTSSPSTLLSLGDVAGAQQITFLPTTGVAMSFGVASNGSAIQVYKGTGATSNEMVIRTTGIDMDPLGNVRWTNTNYNPLTTVDLALSRGSTKTLYVGSDTTLFDGTVVTTKLGLGTTTLPALLSISLATSAPSFDISSSTGASMMRVLANGNVGVNSSSPIGTLSVVGTGNTTGTTAFAIGSAAGDLMRVSDAGDIFFASSSATFDPNQGVIKFIADVRKTTFPTGVQAQEFGWTNADGSFSDIGGFTGRENYTGNAGLVLKNVGWYVGYSLAGSANDGWQGGAGYIAQNRNGLAVTMFDAANLRWGFNSTTPNATLAVKGSGSNTLVNFTSSTNASAFLIDSSGRVGINTSTPSEKLQVVGNISNIIGPGTTVSQIATVGVGGAPRGIFVSGRYAYTASYNSSTISIVDISDPSIPVQISTTSVTNNPVSIYVSGRYAYTANLGNNTVSVIDISNPFTPFQVSNFSLNLTPLSIYVSGRYAYTVNSNNTLSVLDISNPKALTVVTTTPIEASGVDVGSQAVFVSGRYAYTANASSNTISIVDISDPSKAVQIATTSVGFKPTGIYVSGRYAYTANNSSNTISVVDVSNPYAPRQIATTSVGSVGTGPQAIYVSGRYAYVANANGSSISVVDISSSTAPLQITTVSVGTFPQAIYVSGRYAYVASRDSNSMSVVDISGTEVTSLIAHSAEVGNIQSRNDIFAQGNIMAGTSLLVGAGGILSQGALSVFASSTASSSILALSSAASSSILNVFANGFVGIGTATLRPTSTLDVQGQLEVNLTSPVEATFALCHDTNGGANNQVIYDCNGTPGADYMEMYAADAGLQKGDVVALSNTFVTTSDGSVIPKLSKSATAYQSGLVGVISDVSQAGDFNSVGYNINSADNPLPLALSGRVFIKVNNINGDIHVGDKLTSSNIPGVAMKATEEGSSIAIAMGDYTSASVGTVMSFVNIGWNNKLYRALTVDTASSTLTVGSPASPYNLIATGNISLTGTSVVNKLSFATSTLFESDVAAGFGARAFTFNAANFITPSADNYIVSVRANNNPVFSIAANGDVHALGNYFGASAVLGTSTNPGDLAEWVDIAIDDTVEPGDVMMVDENAPDTYRRSGSAYAQSVAGIISSNPTIIVGNGKTDYTAVMAMVGRVPVKVSNENGNIKRGDLLVAASAAGFAMKYDSTKDKNDKMVGIIGVALEPLNTSTGKILTLIRTGWVYNRDQAINNLQNNIEQMAVAQGINLSSSSSPGNLNIQNTNGQLSYTGGNLDLQNNSIINVAGIISKDNKWRIDEWGNLIQKIATANGDKEIYGLQSAGKQEIVISGTSTLENGFKKVILADLDQAIIDKTVPLKIMITPSGETKGVYVSERSYDSFVVKENDNGQSNAAFDWTVIAKILPPDLASPPVDTSVSAPVVDVPVVDAPVVETGIASVVDVVATTTETVLSTDTPSDSTVSSTPEILAQIVISTTTP